MSDPIDLPVVLCFSGSDPTGGAGIQADIETLASMGCHCAPVITAITAQDTRKLIDFTSCDPNLLIAQARAVLEDMPVHAIKIGMLGSAENAEAIHSILYDYDQIPVVLDPIIRAGGGGEIASDTTIDAMRRLLLPLTTLVTPNSLEARHLCPDADSLDACAHALMDLGCEHVLITGEHEGQPVINNRYYGGTHQHLETFSWDRHPGHYHGSGCTLAAGITALLGQGLDMLTAVHEAQEFTWTALQHGHRLGMGQQLPNRFFWARDEQDAH